MTDVNSNIHVGLNSSEALAGLRSLQTQITTFNQAVIASNAAAARSQAQLISTLRNGIDKTGGFTSYLTTVESRVASLGKSIDRSRLSLGEYVRYSAGASKTLGRIFGKEQAEIMDLATDRVKRLQTQYTALGQTTNGLTKALAVRPLHLFNADMAVSIQRQQLMNKLLRDGSTSLVNFGKNTQWAGRQLMVGFSVPLTGFAIVAGRAFADIEKAIVSFQRVYGDAMTTAAETEKASQGVRDLAREYSKYGIAISDTITLASKAAATGLQGNDLLAATEQATRFATLGQFDYQQALDSTIAMQSAFGISAQDLGQKINFLNAVENQTVTSMEDLSEAIPIVAPVIKGLGGTVEDMAVLLTAMREGGVSAAEGANALKSGLASLINPAKSARENVAKFGIDLDAIVNQNNGNFMGIINDFADALNQLDGMSKQQVLSDLFGKYQFARLGALFNNINRDGSQAQRVLDLMGQSAGELGMMAGTELSKLEEAVSVKFLGSIERLKEAIAPVGETFMQMATPVIDAISQLLGWFNSLGDTGKQVLVGLTVGFGVIIPGVTMLVGLFANGVGQIIKFGLAIRGFMQRLREGGNDLGYMADAEIEAAAAAASLEGRTSSLTSTLNVNRQSVDMLTQAYKRMAAAASVAMQANPDGFRPAPGTLRPTQRRNSGGEIAGYGDSDTQPALLTPGEFVVRKAVAQRNLPFLQALNAGMVKGFDTGGYVNVGGRSFAINASSDKSLHSIQKRADSIANSTEKVEAFIAILEKFSNSLGVTVSHIDKAMFLNPVLKSDSKYLGNLNRSSPDWVRSQSDTMLPNVRRQLEPAIVEALKDSWGEVSKSQINNLLKIQASHITEEKTPEGYKRWRAQNLFADSGAVNNYLNRARTGAEYILRNPNAENADAVIARIMEETGQSANIVRKELDLLAKNIHPTTKRSASILQSFARIDSEASLAAKSLASKMGVSLGDKAKNSLGMGVHGGYQGAAAAAALGVNLANAREVYGAGRGRYVQAGPEVALSATGRGLASALNNGVKKELGINSPSIAAQQVIDDYVKGMYLGAVKNRTELEAAAGVAAGSFIGESEDIYRRATGAYRVNPTQGSRFVDNGVFDDLEDGLEELGYTTKEAAEETKKSTGKTSAVMFGLTAAVGAASTVMSFIPGPMQEFASKAMMASVVLESVVGASMILKGAMGAGGIAGAFAGLMNPIGGVIAGLTAVAAIGTAVYLVYKKSQEEIAALGRAATFSADQVKNLGEAFGFTPWKTGLDASQAGETSSESGSKAAELIKQALASEQDTLGLKAFRDDLNKAAIMGPEAVTALVTKATYGLINMGMDKAIAQNVVGQIADQVGRADVAIKVKAEIDSVVGDDGAINDVTKFVNDNIQGQLTALEAIPRRIDEIRGKIDAMDSEWTIQMGIMQASNASDLDEQRKLEAQLEQINQYKSEIANLEKMQQASSARMGEVVKSTFVGLSAQFNNGKISAEEFAQGVQDIESAISELPNNAGLEYVKKTINELNPGFEEAVSKITNVGQGLDLLSVQASGVSITSFLSELATAGEMTAQLQGKLATMSAMSKALKLVNDEMANQERRKAEYEAWVAQYGDSVQDEKTADSTKVKIAQLEIANIKIDQKLDGVVRSELSKRFGTLNISGIRINNMADAQRASAALGEKIEDIQRGPLRAAQDRVDAINESIAKLNDQQDKINRQIELYNRNIEDINKRYDKMLEPLEKVKTNHENIIRELEREMDMRTRGIRDELTLLENRRVIVERTTQLQTEALDEEREAFDKASSAQLEALDEQIQRNEDSRDLVQDQIDKINEQVDALERVSDINEMIANQQRSQLDLAEALTSGDMGAAARAMAEARSQQAEDASKLQRQGLEDSLNPLNDRLAQLDANGDMLGDKRSALEKQIEEQNELFDKRAEKIREELELLNKQIEALEYQRQVIVDGYDVRLQLSRDEIANAEYRMSIFQTQRDAEIKFWQDQIDNYAPQLREIADQIYNKQQEIKGVQDNQIANYEKQIEKIQRQKELLDDVIGDSNAIIEAQKISNDAKIKSLELEQKIRDLQQEQLDLNKQIKDYDEKRPRFLQAQYDQVKNTRDKLVEISSDYGNLETQLGEFFNDDVWRGYANAVVGGSMESQNAWLNEINTSIIGPLNQALRQVGAEQIPTLGGMKKPTGGREPSIRTFEAPRKALARGGILPGFTPVSQGDDQMVHMRSGEGVTVSEALRGNSYETSRLLDLNHHALSGTMDKFYAKYGPGFATGGIIPNHKGFAGMDSNFVAALQNWARQTGKTWTMTGMGGFRTYAEQQKLYNDYLYRGGNLAANPDKNGPHQRGVAIDLSPRPGENPAARGLLPRNNLGLTVRKEPWHVGWLGAGGSPLGGLPGMLSAPNVGLPANVNMIQAGVVRLVRSILARVVGYANGMMQTGDASSPFGGYTGGSGVERWRPTASTALDIMGQSQSLIGSVLRRMNQESGGNPRAVNNWDVNARRGTPSVGLMQVIGPTYRANKHLDYDTGPYLYGTSVNPLANILASMKYALKRYGSLPKAYDRAGGYSEGGIVLRDSGGILPPGRNIVNNATGGFEWIQRPDQLNEMVSGFVKSVLAPTFEMPVQTNGPSISVQDSGNMYTIHAPISITATDGQSAKEIADAVLDRLNGLQNNNVRGMGGFQRVSVRS